MPLWAYDEQRELQIPSANARPLLRSLLQIPVEQKWCEIAGVLENFQSDVRKQYEEDFQP